MPQSYRSRIVLHDLAARSQQVVFEGEGVVEAPNWSRDGRYLLVNRDGGLFRVHLTAPALEALPLSGGEYRCNNDHDFSPDGKRIAFSAATPDSPHSRVFVCNADGSDVRLVTQSAPSYFHGWSPDGEWLAFIAERGDGKFEIYRVPAAGGREQRLTSTGGYDDGSEYSPDGQWIYFNSNRGGRWNIWRMPVDGAGDQDHLAQQITNDAPEDWFPHLSPDGNWLLFLSFPPGTEGHDDRLPGMQLRLRRAPGAQPEPAVIQIVSEFFGGQGSINVNSWSPDSQRFAYVIYEPNS